VFEHHFNNFRI